MKQEKIKAPWNDLYLSRLDDNGKETIGYSHYSNGFDSLALNTLELPWKNNKENISCIPVGTYPFKKRYSNKNSRTVIGIYDVPNRTEIEIHIANYVYELKGCIAVGIGKADINGDGLMDVTKSKAALYALLAILPESGFIHINNAFETKTEPDISS